MKVIYQGISEARQKEIIERRVAGMDPPEKPAQELYYHISDRDGAVMQQKKLARTAEWMAEQKAEVEKEVAGLHDLKELQGLKFPRGEEVEIPDTHNLVGFIGMGPDGIRKTLPGKIHALIEAGDFVRVTDEGTETKEPTPLAAEAKKEAQEARKRGRPRGVVV